MHMKEPFPCERNSRLSDHVMSTFTARSLVRMTYDAEVGPSRFQMRRDSLQMTSMPRNLRAGSRRNQSTSSQFSAASFARPQLPHAQSNSAAPDFGPNVLLFDPSMPSAEIQAQIDKVYAIQQHSEFGTARYALLFLPGEYHVDIPVGFYTQVLGLGATPDAVHITGNVHSDASLPRNNATCTFWRAAEGFSVTPTGGTMQWAVSQAVPFRRMHVLGNIVLHQKGGWASGGWMSDSLVDGNVGAGPQQQWISRNSEWGSWTGANWNMVFVGVPHPPAGEWPTPPYTKIERTPIVREKPFLEVDAKGNWSVRVPGAQHRQPGHHLARRINTRPIDSSHPVLHRAR